MGFGALFAELALVGGLAGRGVGLAVGAGEAGLLRARRRGRGPVGGMVHELAHALEPPLSAGGAAVETTRLTSGVCGFEAEF